MGKLIVSENITLDGVVEDRTGEDGFENGSWFTRGMGDDREPWADAEFAEAREASALLMGRGTDAYFGARWNTQPGAWADRLRALPKYVVSATIDEPVWMNSTVLRGDVIDNVRELKTSVDGAVVVYGSRPLVQALLGHGLVDEVRLMVFPVVLGSGRGLFDDGLSETPLRLRSAERIGTGILRVVYDIEDASKAAHAPE